MTTTAFGGVSARDAMADIYVLPPRPQHVLYFQPVFSADGRVYEYALSVSTMAAQDSFARATTLRHLIDFSERTQNPLRFSLDRAFGGCNEPTVAQMLAAELSQAMAFGRRVECVGEPACKDSPDAPTDRIIFTLPRSHKQGDLARVIAMFTDFDVHFRTLLVPHFHQGKRSDFSELRVMGIRVSLPESIAHSLSLKTRFLSLLDFATSRGLDVLVSGINDIADFDWLRPLPSLLFQGNALCTRLSSDLLKEWWAHQPDWQAFTFGTAVERSDWQTHFSRLAALG